MSRATRADLVLLLVTLLAAAGWIFSKEALAGMPPLLFVGVRFFLAGLVLLIFARGDWAGLSRQGLWPRCLAVGLVMAVALLAWIHGLYYGAHLGEGAFITSLGVVLIPVMARLIYRDRVPLATWLSLPVAMLGLAFLSLQGGFTLAPGQLYFLTAALLFSLHFTLVARLTARVPAVVLTGTQLVMVGVVSLGASALTETWPAGLALSVTGWLLASILIATCLRFALQTYGQSLAPVSHVALIMILEPVWTALLGALWYGETMVPLQWLGCGLIFGAMLISRWRWVKALWRPSRSRNGRPEGQAQ